MRSEGTSGRGVLGIHPVSWMRWVGAPRGGVATSEMKRRPNRLVRLPGGAPAIPTVAVLLFLALGARVSADETPGEFASPGEQRRFLALPFAFSDESLGFSYGVGGLVSGWPHWPAVVGGAVVGSDRGAFLLGLVGRDLPLGAADRTRLFCNFDLLVGDYPEQRTYFAPVTPPGEVRRGAHGSSDDSFFSGAGRDDLVSATLKLALPWGEGKEGAARMFGAARGRPAARYVDPRGRTWLALRASWRRQTYEGVVGKLATRPIELYLLHDGTDHLLDPTRGQHLRVSIRRDPGGSASSDTWTDLQLEWAGHWSLGSSEHTRRRVLATALWTAWVPTWKESKTEEGTVVRHRPPPYTGATLGGFWHLRAYPSGRYQDRAALLYSAELRTTLRWNPAGPDTVLAPLALEWIQLVAFAEVGRVAPSWNLRELNRDPKYDLGAGVRLFLMGAVIRVDAAFAPGNRSVLVMAGQAF